VTPAYEKHARENNNPNVLFTICNTEWCKDVPQSVKVEAIPTIVGFLHGDEMKRFKGMSKRALQLLIDEIK